MSAELRALASKVDLWDADDKEEIAESMDEVRGMTRCAGRSPGADKTELTEEDAERSGSLTREGLGVVLSPGPAVTSDPSVLVVSGETDVEWAGFEGGTGKGALAIRDIGDRFCAGDALALVLGERGLWEEGESSFR